MNDLVQQFIDYMRANGCAPANSKDIIPSGEDAYFRIAEDKKDKRGGYCLTIDSDFAHGNFINFKTGDKGNWHSKKAVKGLSDQERAEIKARIAASEAEKKLERERIHEEKADEARALWATCKPAREHPYVEVKGVSYFNSRMDGDDLILPMYATDGLIWSYQRINPDGSKWYLTAARKNGLYCPLSTGTPVKDTMILCEGFATGASVRMAYPEIPVIVCFDAYNLLYVAQALRLKYKHARIVIAGDNDNSGTGQEKAQQAARKVNGFSIVPEQAEHDFNDVHKEFGLDAVRERLDAVVSPILPAALQAVHGEIQSPPIDLQLSVDTLIHHSDAPPHELDDLIPIDIPTHHIAPAFDDKKTNNSLIWKKYPSELDEGKLEPNSLHNILVFLRHKEKYNGLFRYDRFAQRTILHKCPPWEESRTFKVRKITDIDIRYVSAMLEREPGKISPSEQKVGGCIELVAKENWINPPLDYFQSLKWDGTQRIKNWLFKYLSAQGERDYITAVGMAWLVAGVARIYEPGCKAENMLVLEGEQGAMKSTALSIMANVGNGSDEESYFCDTLTFADIRDKDSVLKLQGKLIVEFAELASLGSREIEEVKSWMSTQFDEIRKPYGRETEKFPRQFILAGSTNESLWLKDQTGNRRFWPVRVGKVLIHELKMDREQLWAEAVHMYKEKSTWWLDKTSAIWGKAEVEQDMRLLEDIWAVPVEEYTDRRPFVTVPDILSNIGISVSDQNRGHQARVISILKRLKFHPGNKWLGGKTVRGWAKEVKEEEIPFD